MNASQVQAARMKIDVKLREIGTKVVKLKAEAAELRMKRMTIVVATPKAATPKKTIAKKAAPKKAKAKAKAKK